MGNAFLTCFPRLLADHTGLRIPVPASILTSLQIQLPVSSLELLMPVAGYHRATAAFAGLIVDSPPKAGEEMTTTIAMFNLLATTFQILGTFSNTNLSVSVNLKRADKRARDLSSAVLYKARPDTLVVLSMATLMIGVEKPPDRLREAITDLELYIQGGLGSVQYGAVPGILGYAASGLTLQFFFISQAGQVGVARH